MKKSMILMVLALSLTLCSCGKEAQEPVDADEAISNQDSGQEKEQNQEEEPVSQENDQEEADTENTMALQEQIMEAYQQIVQAEQIKIDRAHKAGKEAYGHYVFGDINQDGIPELMVMTGSCAADESWKCYSHNGKSVYQTGNFPGGHMNLCSGQEGIYSFYAQMGYVEISKLIWEGGKGDITTETVYTNDTNDFVDEDYDALLQTFELEQLEITEISGTGSSGTGEQENPEVPESESMAEEVLPVVEGSYWEGDKSPTGALYYIEISNGTSEGFDFEIFGRDNMDDAFTTVFKHHTAVYNSANSAVYDGQNYTLTFRWTEQGYLSVDGFTERIPAADILYNNDYLGVS